VTLPFDRVTLAEDGRTRTITLEELRAITLNRRVRLILDNRIEFWRGDIRVSHVVALRALQQQAAAARRP
jgi:hypothetical protein